MTNYFYPEGKAQGGFAQNSVFSAAMLADAVATDKILQAKVVSCDAEHNLYVELGAMKGIIPREQGALGIETGKVRDIALISRVGKSVCFTVSNLLTDSQGKPYALLSRRNAQQICMENFVLTLSAGDIIDARITHLDSFGAFCDIGCGIIALLPIDAISVSRISHPKDRFFVGQNIKAVIKNIASDGRITLTHKELLGTWEQNVQSLCQGETVSGIIRSVEDYGVFIELSPNLAGLAEPKEDVFAGQTAGVYIKSIIPEKMKIKLIIIDAFGTAEPPALNYYIDSGHIDSWQYSPEGCFKKIESLF